MGTVRRATVGFPRPFALKQNHPTGASHRSNGFVHSGLFGLFETADIQPRRTLNELQLWAAWRGTSRRSHGGVAIRDVADTGMSLRLLTSDNLGTFAARAQPRGRASSFAFQAFALSRARA